MATRRRQTLAAIDAMGRHAGVESRVLKALAVHESRADWLAEHRLAADQRAAAVSLNRNLERYRGSPYLPERYLWLVGRGPLGMVPANHVYLRSVDASPLELHDPVTAALIAFRRVLRLVSSRRRGEKRTTTWQHVHRSWKYGQSEPPRIDAATLEAGDAKWRTYVDALYPQSQGEGSLADAEIPSSSSISERADLPRDDELIASVWLELEAAGLAGRPTPLELATRAAARSGASSSSSGGAGLSLALLGVCAVAALGAALWTASFRGRKMQR